MRIDVKTISTLIITTTLLMSAATPTFAQESPADATAEEKRPITVAVLNFDVGQSADPQLASLFSDVVAIMLTSQGDFQVVDRTSIEQTLQEQSLSLTGLVSNEDAVRIGKLVGARLLVIGKVIEVGKARMMTAKVIGTETTLMNGVLVKGDLASPPEEMIAQLANDLATKIVEVGPQLVAQDDAPDTLQALLDALKDQPLPSVAVIIPEEHLRQRTIPLPQPPDPAAETEIKKRLTEAGFKVLDVPQNDLVDWSHNLRTGGSNAPWPQGLSDVDYVIVGEAFSEEGGSIQRLQTATARLEINVIARADGRIVLADRATARAVDLSPEIAGKTALQRTGHVMALRVLQYFVDHQEAEPQPEE